MQINTNLRGTTSPIRRRRPAAVLLASVGLGGVLTGCGDSDGPTAASSSPRQTDKRVLWLGDSIAGAEAQRSADGIHSCQQGSAAFAKWFTEQLGKAYDFTPAAAEKWAQGSWVSDRTYADLGCD